MRSPAGVDPLRVVVFCPPLSGLENPSYTACGESPSTSTIDSAIIRAMRRTKIVATIGPASQDEDSLRKLIAAGMDVARLNFSHGSHNTHRQVFQSIRKLSDETGKPVAVLQDLSGPKMRIGVFEKGQISLQNGQTFRITTEEIIGDDSIVSTSYQGLADELSNGDTILLADGLIELEVVRVDPPVIHCQVINGGPLRDRRGINLPGVTLKTPALTEKDKRDLELGIELGVDWVALSFVQRPDDLHQIKAFLRARDAEDIPVIAKIERPQAIENLTAILDLCAGVMVARGDLGIELPPEKVPLLQKRIVRMANDRDVPTVVATQMLESMIREPRPTRAEASDVANAILDGTDAVMLSGETAVGEYPVRAVEMMNRIIREVEAHQIRSEGVKLPWRIEEQGLGWIRDEEERIAKAVCHSAWSLSRDVEVKAICALTKSGFTANLISNYRPPVPIYAYAEREEVRRRLALCWGVEARPIGWTTQVDDLVAQVEADLIKNKALAAADMVVLLFGYPLQRSGITNLCLLRRLEGNSTEELPAPEPPKQRPPACGG
jgi:pyruvate kinase